MQQIILIIHVLVAIALIAMVLLQHGKGADAGATFGSSASNTMFGSQGSLPFLIKITGILAGIFFATSLTLSFLAAHSAKLKPELDFTAPATQPIPLKDVPPIPRK